MASQANEALKEKRQTQVHAHTEVASLVGWLTLVITSTEAAGIGRAWVQGQPRLHTR